MKRTNWKAIPVTSLTEDSFWVKVDEERLASQNLIDDLHDHFCSKPSTKLVEASSNPSSGKKSKELKVLDAKAAQNLSVVLGMINHSGKLSDFLIL